MATKAKRPLTNAERQARYREKHMESIEGDKERAQFIFEIGVKKRLERIARHYGYLSATALIEQWRRRWPARSRKRRSRKLRKQSPPVYEHNA